MDLNFAERLEAVLLEESTEPRRTWWLSFAEEHRFLGVVLVDNCRGLAEARLKLTFSGFASPGGEIQAIGFDPADIPPEQQEAFAKAPREILLSKADLMALGIEIGKI